MEGARSAQRGFPFYFKGSGAAVVVITQYSTQTLSDALHSIYRLPTLRRNPGMFRKVVYYTYPPSKHGMSQGTGIAS